MENFHAPSQSLAECFGTNRNDHIFLVVTLLSAYTSVKDVHKRHWQYRCINTSQVTKQGSLASFAAALAAAIETASNALAPNLPFIISAV